MPDSEITTSVLSDFNSVTAKRYRRWRDIKDVLTRYLMAAGGVSVLVAIVLIAFYLLYVVLPMFKPAHIEHLDTHKLPGDSNDRTVHYAMEEQHEVGLRVTDTGNLYFFNTKEGSIINQYDLLKDKDSNLTSFSAGDSTQSVLAFGTDDGKVFLVQHLYEVTYPEDKRLITPYLFYPLGDSFINLADGISIQAVSAQSDGETTTIAALTDDDRLIIRQYIKEESFLDDEVTLSTEEGIIPVAENLNKIVLDVEQRELYTTDEKGFIDYYDISNINSPRLIQHIHAVPEGTQITSIEFLSGGISICR